MPIFTNPSGLWALSAIPIILAIHLLQRKAQSLKTTTLFLLEKNRYEAMHGRRLDRIRNSLPLWMQLIAILLTTWLLLQPRFPVSQQIHRIAIVLDGSASMIVSKARLQQQLSMELKKWEQASHNCEFIVLESTPDQPPLYLGTSMEEMMTAIKKWEPMAGETDPTTTLRLARSLVTNQGTVAYLTDTIPSHLPSNVIVLSMGKKIINAGFTGISFDTNNGELIWRVNLQNYSDDPVTRTWQLKTNAHAATMPKTIELPPRRLITLQGTFPKNADRLMLVLSGDEFPLDDQIFFVPPAPKKINLSYEKPFAPLAGKLIRAIEGVVADENQPTDVTIRSIDPLNPQNYEDNSLIFLRDETQGTKYRAGGIIAAKHPWMDGLNWQSLVVRDEIGMDLQPRDEILLRQNNRPLIVYRHSSDQPSNQTAKQQLLFHFDPNHSNLENQPAWIVLLLRFLDHLRNEKIGYFRDQYELSQPITLAMHSSESDDAIIHMQIDLMGNIITENKIEQNHKIKTAAQPGFYRYAIGNRKMIDLANNFADTRESDFQSCSQVNQWDKARHHAMDNLSTIDPYRPIWIMLLMACLLISWYRKQNTLYASHTEYKCQTMTQ